MELYVVRHAIAAERDAASWPDDGERPLIDRGIDRFRQAARGLATLVPSVDLVLSSPYARAWGTAELLNEEAGWPEPQRCVELEAVRPPAGVVPVLQEHADRSPLAIVGHEPQLSMLVSLLVAGDEGALAFDLKKGGVVSLGFAGAPGPRGAFMRWSISPKILRSLGGG